MPIRNIQWIALRRMPAQIHRQGSYPRRGGIRFSDGAPRRKGFEKGRRKRESGYIRDRNSYAPGP